MLGSLGMISGYRLIVSHAAYRLKTQVRGLADKNRPNNKKPLYRRVTVKIPLIMRVGDAIICAPEWEARIRQELERQPARGESGHLLALEYLKRRLK